MGEVPACAVEKEGHDLFEELLDRRALSAFTHGTKHPFHTRAEVNTPQIAGEKIQSAPTCHDIGSCLDIGNAVWMRTTTRGHEILHQMGD